MKNKSLELGFEWQKGNTSLRNPLCGMYTYPKYKEGQQREN